MQKDPQIKRDPSDAGGAGSPQPTPRSSRIFWTLLAGGVGLLVLTAAVIGAYLGSTYAAAPSAPVADGEAVTWTCSMHPQVDLPKPGKCPICFMDLIPLRKEKEDSHGPRTLTMSPSAMALAEIETMPVERRFVANTVRMVGKVDYDEKRVSHITAWVPGRLDRLYVDFTGVSVREGDHMVYMYSPELVLAQRALLQAWQAYERAPPNARTGFVADNLKSAEEKLRLWGLFDEQIEEIKQRGTPSDHMTINAPTGGVVVEKNANQGMYVETGSRIYTIADLSQVWIFLAAYESDHPWIRYGQEVEFTTEAFPGEIFRGRIAFIDRVLDETTRTFKVRVNVPNPGLRLKPGMFVRAEVTSRLVSEGQVVDASLAGKWISPMHPEIIKDAPGKCDICGMDLVSAEEFGFITDAEEATPPLVIPASAPLITGKRAVVYVRLPGEKEPTFEGREVVLGERADDWYVVRHGLAEGEQVVVNGNFKIDADLQIGGQPSMMSPRGAAPPQHRHGATGEMADTPGDKSAGPSAEIPSQFRVALSPIYDAYLSAAGALADDDLSAARREVDELLAAIEMVDAAALTAPSRGQWEQLANRLALAGHETAQARDRENARESFAELSESALEMIRAFGHALEEPLEAYHCPMARDNEGAMWLQFGPELRNPYLGRAMLNCGEPRSSFAPNKPLEVPKEFREQLVDLYGAYLDLQSALAADETAEASDGFGRFVSSLEQIDAESLDAPALGRWRDWSDRLAGEMNRDGTANSMVEIRWHFQEISKAMVELAADFGHAQSGPLQQVFCPMAFDNEGASWLQAEGEISNPYFGAKMLRCGQIERTFIAASRVQEPQP